MPDTIAVKKMPSNRDENATDDSSSEGSDEKRDEESESESGEAPPKKGEDEHESESEEEAQAREGGDDGEAADEADDMRNGVLMVVVSESYEFNFCKDLLLKEWALGMINAKGYDIRNKKPSGEPHFYAVKIPPVIAEYVNEEDLERNKKYETTDENAYNRTKWKMFGPVMKDLYPYFPLDSLETFLVAKAPCEYNLNIHCDLPDDGNMTGLAKLKFKMIASLFPPWKEGQRTRPSAVAAWGTTNSKDRGQLRVLRSNDEFQLKDIVEYLAKFRDEENHGFPKNVPEGEDVEENEENEAAEVGGDDGDDGEAGEDNRDNEAAEDGGVDSEGGEEAAAAAELPNVRRAGSRPESRPPTSSPPRVPAADPGPAEASDDLSRLKAKLLDIRRTKEWLKKRISNAETERARTAALLRTTMARLVSLQEDMKKYIETGQRRTTKAFQHVEQAIEDAKADRAHLSGEIARLDADVKELGLQLEKQVGKEASVDTEISAEKRAMDAENRAAKAEARADGTLTVFAGLVEKFTEQRQQGGVARIANSMDLPQHSTPASVPRNNTRMAEKGGAKVLGEQRPGDVEAQSGGNPGGAEQGRGGGVAHVDAGATDTPIAEPSPRAAAPHSAPSSNDPPEPSLPKGGSETDKAATVDPAPILCEATPRSPATKAPGLKRSRDGNVSDEDPKRPKVAGRCDTEGGGDEVIEEAVES